MPGMDVFNQDAFSMQSLTAAVNEMPYVPSRLRDMQLFAPKPVTTTNIAIEKKGTTLSLVPVSPRGAPPEARTRDARTIRNLITQRLAKEAVIYADQVQGVRAFGSETETEMVQRLVNQEVSNVRAEIDLTEENMMLGAVKGIVADSDGSTIYNLFTEFGVSQLAAVSFALGTDTTDVRSKCQQVIRSMAKELKAGAMQFRVHALCGDDFFDALIGHPDVKSAYERWQDGAALRENYAYQVFPFAGINFENYRSTDDGSSVAVNTDEAHFFAVGVPGLFDVAYAPADTIDTVNTLGLPRYVLPGMDPSGKQRYMSMEVQTNVLPYCTRPRTLIKGTRT